MFSYSSNSANFSGVDLNIKRGGTELNDNIAKIFPPTLKQRSSPHCRFSVTCGKERQKRRMDSTLIGRGHLKMLGKSQQSHPECSRPIRIRIGLRSRMTLQIEKPSPTRDFLAG